MPTLIGSVLKILRSAIISNPAVCILLNELLLNACAHPKSRNGLSLTLYK